MQKLIVYFLCIFCFSCGVQKRKYLKGYYLGSRTVKSNAILNKKTTTDYLDHHSVKRHQVKPIQNQIQVTEKNQNELHNPIVSTVALPNDSCDTIIFRDGSEIDGKIIEITSNQIKYKRCDLLNGPLYVIKKSEVFMIKYFGGVREVIKEEVPAYTPPAERPAQAQSQSNNTNPSSQNKFQVTHPKSIKAFIYGLLSFLTFLGIGSSIGLLLFLFSITAAIISIVASAKATKLIRNFPNDFKGKGLAITGRVLSIIVLSIVTLFIAIALLLI